MKKKTLKRDYKLMENVLNECVSDLEELEKECNALKEENAALRESCESKLKAAALIANENIRLKKELATATSASETKNYIAIKNVTYESKNDVTVVNWSDGTKTIVKRHKGDKADKQTAIAFAIAKRMLANSGISLSSIAKAFDTTPEDKKFEKLVGVYNRMSSKNRGARIQAQKEWEKLDDKVRKSVKSRIHDTIR